MAKITNIKEVTNLKLDGDYHSYSGYEIELDNPHRDRNKIYLLIDDCQDCCEDWGYLLCEDDKKDFIGALVGKITTTDTRLMSTELALKKRGVIDSGGVLSSLDAGEVIFINIHTNRGVFQFTAYNQHNGYYGHVVKIVSDFFKLETII